MVTTCRPRLSLSVPMPIGTYNIGDSGAAIGDSGTTLGDSGAPFWIAAVKISERYFEIVSKTSPVEWDFFSKLRIVSPN